MTIVLTFRRQKCPCENHVCLAGNVEENAEKISQVKYEAGIGFFLVPHSCTDSHTCIYHVLLQFTLWECCCPDSPAYDSKPSTFSFFDVIIVLL